MSSEQWTFERAVEACRTALSLADDLPDGMAEELRDARAIYRQTKDREGFAEDIRACFESWGFSFGGAR
ncbi:MAG: hypothetical protein IT186_15990 [Acidobacteria bacterium]|nr:hypothetical protein [Acidobacteriota bacterium]